MVSAVTLWLVLSHFGCHPSKLPFLVTVACWCWGIFFGFECLPPPVEVSVAAAGTNCLSGVCLPDLPPDNFSHGGQCHWISKKIKISSPTVAWERNFPPFSEILTDRQTDGQKKLRFWGNICMNYHDDEDKLKHYVTPCQRKEFSFNYNLSLI